MTAMTRYSGGSPKFSQGDYKKIAHSLKNKLERNAADTAKMTRRFSALAFGVGAAGAGGYLMGKREKELKPTEMGGLPYTAWAGLAAAGAGLFLGGVTKSKKLAWVNDAIEAGGAGLLNGAAYKYAYDKAKAP